MTKKTRTAKLTSKAKAPKAIKSGNGSKPETLAAVAAAPSGACVLKIGENGTESPTLTAAQTFYCIARDESGKGASEFPEGAVYQDGTQVARISYNGRAWNMGGKLIAEAPPAAKFRSITSDLARLAAPNAEPVAEQPATDQAAAPVEAEQLAPATTFKLSGKLLAAALAIAPKKDNRHYLNGVYLHQTANDLRMVATDGTRLIVLTIPADGETHERHAWGEAGVILPAEEMGRISKYVGKAGGLSIGYGVGHPHVSVTELGGMAKFAVSPIDGRFPDYMRVVADASGAFTTEREPTETAAVASEYIKSAGMVAAVLESKAVFPFVGADGKCTIFTFSDEPGALLYIMPLRSNVPALSAQTVALIGEAGMAGTLAALKAHETRTRTAANNQRLSKEDRAKLTEKADGYKNRADTIRAALVPKLAGPAPSPTTSETGETESEGVTN